MSATNGDLPAVLVDDVHKRFRLPREQVHTLKERVLHPLRRSEHDVLEALRGVSLEVAHGEFFGIVGRNGSGKSTLLKCLAGIYRTDQGRIYVNGSMATFIELGVGFNPDLAARDNVELNATMLGLNPAQARDRFESILAFAELEEFVDLKLKNYSSGMLVRLAFSTMIQVDADILLIDEVLAVGDAAFQQKCYEEFHRIRDQGKTVLLVTHDMGSVRRFCDRAMLLEHGRMVAVGDPEKIGNRYLELNFSEAARAESEQRGPEVAPDKLELRDDERITSGRAEIAEGWFENEDGLRSEALQVGRPASFVARVRFAEDVADPVFSVELVNSQRQRLMIASTQWTDPRPGVYAAGEEILLRLHFRAWLAADRYQVTVGIEQEGHRNVERRERMATVVVTSTASSGAVAELPYSLMVERSGSRQPAGSRR